MLKRVPVSSVRVGDEIVLDGAADGYFIVKRVEAGAVPGRIALYCVRHQSVAPFAQSVGHLTLDSDKLVGVRVPD